jgi:hypothetical protein
MENIKKIYEAACNEYAAIFCKKQGLYFDGWVADDVGGVACCSDFYLGLHDIVWDINSKQRKGLILRWYDESLKNHPKSVNYYSYTKGLRYKDLK